MKQRSYQFLRRSKNTKQIMETEGSLLCSQKPTTSPYHEPQQTSAQISRFFNRHFNIILPSRSRILKCKLMTTKLIWCYKQKAFTKTYLTVYEFRGNRLSESQIYLSAWMNFYPQFPHLLSEMGKFQYKKSAGYIVWCFDVGENWHKLRPYFYFRAQIKLNLRVYLETIWHSSSKERLGSLCGVHSPCK